MIAYKDFIDIMEQRGYIFKSNNPITINEHNRCIRAFSVKKGSISKVLEIQCPENNIMSICGRLNSEDWKQDYSVSIRCFDDKDNEPFQEFHRCIVLTANKHTIADIIVTKIIQNNIDNNDPKIREFLRYAEPILKFIGSRNNFEYPIWSGNYKTFHKEFLDESLNLYGNERIIFYLSKSDIDISKVKFNIKIDIFERKAETEKLIILDKNKITNTNCRDYKTYK